MVLGKDQLGVEFVDNVDVGVVDESNGGGCSCECDSSSKLVRVGSTLGSLVMAS